MFTRRFSIGLTLLLTAASLISCARPRPRLDPAAHVLRPTIRVELPGPGRVLDLDLEAYVAGSVLAEADFRGLKTEEARQVARIQAILARTYALSNRGRHAHEGFDVCSTTHCQVYQPVETTPGAVVALAQSAVRATTGLVITHHNQPINAVFHAHCGGGTSDASVAWGGSTPAYLRGTGDTFCLRDGRQSWRFEVGHAELLDALNADPLTHVGGQIRDVRPTAHDRGGRVVEVMIEGDASTAVVRGEQFRRVLVQRFGAQSIKSTRFRVDSLADRFIFEGRGFGHGVGLCQHGAVARVKAGHTPTQILTHYYPGTQLKRYHYQDE